MDGLTSLLAFLFAISSPFWFLVTCVAYIVGRRTFGLKVLFALISGEAICLALAITSFSLLMPPDPPYPVAATAFMTAVASPLWVPFVGIAFGMGRKCCTAPYFLLVGFVEIITLWIVVCGLLLWAGGAF